jgi:hypothetical protein
MMQFMKTLFRRKPKPQYADRWGFDNETGEFLLLLHPSAPLAEYTIMSTIEARETLATGGDELRVKATPGSDGFVSVKLYVAGRLVDSAGCKPRPTTCPHCGKNLTAAEGQRVLPVDSPSSIPPGTVATPC